MEKLTPIPGLQYFFAFFGYNFNLVHKIHFKIMLWTVLAINLIMINYCAFEQGTKVRTNMSYIQRSIMTYQSVQFWWFYHSLIFKVPQMCQLAITISEHLRHDDIIRCRKVSFAIFLSFLVMFAPNLSMFSKSERAKELLIESGYNKPNNVLITAVLTFKVYEYSLFNTTTMSNFMYDVMIYALYRGKFNLLRNISRYSTQLDRTSMVNRIHESVNHMNQIHRHFESTMSMYPFLTICDLFLMVSFEVYIMKMFNDISYLVIKGALTLSIILVSNFFNSKLKSLGDAICDGINCDYKIDSQKRLGIIKMIKKSLNEPLTGWGMFNLDLPLILAFLGSHVTFTILFLAE